MAQHIGKATDHPDGTRTCTKCGGRKPLGQFDRVKGATLGRRSDCKTCRSAAMRIRYQSRRELVVAYERQRRIDNADAIRERERLRSQTPKRRALSAARTAVRRARIAGVRVDSGVTRDNLRAQYGDDCFYCAGAMSFQRRRKGDPFTPDLATIEHVSPIALGGSHTWDNVVLACWTCNISKKHTPLDEWAERRTALK